MVKRPGEAWSEPRVLVAPPLSEYSIFYHRLTIDRKGALFLSYDYWSTFWFYRTDHWGSRRALLLSAHALHFLVGVGGVEVVAGRAAAVGDDYAGEPAVRLPVALQDAVNGHDFDVILVRGDRQMGGAREGLRRGGPIGDEKLSRRQVEFHF